MTTSWMTRRARLGVAGAFAALAGGLAAGAATPAAAATMIFDFVGKCSDCTGYGIGELVVKDFTPGQALTAANFVSFTYTSSFVQFSVDAKNLSAFWAMLDPENLSDAHAMIGGGGETFESSGTGFWAVASSLNGAISGGGGGGGGGASLGGPVIPPQVMDFFSSGDDTSFVVQDFGTEGTFSAVAGGVPEPASWALMILGMAGAGAVLRSRRRTAANIEIA